MKYQQYSVLAENTAQPIVLDHGHVFIWHKGAFHISTDRQRLDMDFIHRFLSHSHWAQDIDRTTLENALRHSLCFGLYRKNRQLGFARLITDHATFAYLSDVFITAEYRGNGLGLWLVQSCLDHPLMAGLRRIMLYTSQAPWLYARAGLEPVNQPDRVWTITRPDIYQQPGTIHTAPSVH